MVMYEDNELSKTANEEVDEAEAETTTGAEPGSESLDVPESTEGEAEGETETTPETGEE